MFDRILVAVDEGESARRAAGVAMAFAATHGATLDLVHVADDASAGETTDPEAVARSVGDDAGLDAACGDHEYHVLDGSMPDALADHVRDTGADLVVIGRTDPSGVGERLFGSATDRLLRRTDVPVLAVPETADVDPAATYDDVLAATDGSETAEAAAAWTRAVAEGFDATMHVVRVVDLSMEGGSFDAGGASDEYLERLEREAAEDIDAYLERAGPTSVDIERAVLRGQRQGEIADYVDEAGVDVVVVGSERSGKLSGQLFGSVTTKLLRTLDVPVLVVSAGGAAHPGDGNAPDR